MNSRQLVLALMLLLWPRLLVCIAWVQSPLLLFPFRPQISRMLHKRLLEQLIMHHAYLLWSHTHPPTLLLHRQQELQQELQLQQLQ